MPDDGLRWTGPISAPQRYHVRADALDEAIAGGEGLVYRAWDTERLVPVALKLLTVLSVDDYARLVERSQPFTAIEHPNVMRHVEVFIGTSLTTDPTPSIDDVDVIYVVADWIEGCPLPDVVDQTDTRRLLGWVADIARGLDALHRHRSTDVPLGIMHRDVKPSNVRITDDGRAVLIDFGVARPVDHGDVTHGVGTYRWRAPEVLTASAPITAKADVWGVGAIAYWALTGRPPGFDGAATAREQLAHAERTRTLGDPVGVSAHVAALLATDPDDRPDDLARWAAQLDTILNRNRKQVWTRPTVIGAAAVLIAVPGVAMLAVARGDGAEGAPSTTAAPQLSAAVGDTWRVPCLGGPPQQTIVTGAQRLEGIEATVRREGSATVATGQLERTASHIVIGSPAGDDTTRYIGGIRADELGAFLVQFQCDRSEVGVPLVVDLVGAASGRRTSIRIESSDEVRTLRIVPEVAGGNPDDDGVSVAVGSTTRIDVQPVLTTVGVRLSNGARYDNRRFDPRLDVVSSDTGVAVVRTTVDGAWELIAVKPGSTTLRASVPGTGLATTLPVEVVTP